MTVEPEQALRDKIETALTGYIEGLGALGLVDRLILVTHKRQGRARLHNVLTKDLLDLAEAADPRFAQMTRLGGKLRRALMPEVNLYTDYVNPSQVNTLKASLTSKKWGPMRELSIPKPNPDLV